MSGQKKRVRTLLDIIQSEGAEVIEKGQTGSGHSKIMVTCDGKRRFFVAASTSGDVRSLVKFRMDVRRWVREVREGNNAGKKVGSRSQAR